MPCYYYHVCLIDIFCQYVIHNFCSFFLSPCHPNCQVTAFDAELLPIYQLEEANADGLWGGSKQLQVNSVSISSSIVIIVIVFCIIICSILIVIHK